MAAVGAALPDVLSTKSLFCKFLQHRGGGWAAIASALGLEVVSGESLKASKARWRSTAQPAAATFEGIVDTLNDEPNATNDQVAHMLVVERTPDYDLTDAGAAEFKKEASECVPVVPRRQFSTNNGGVNAANAKSIYLLLPTVRKNRYLDEILACCQIGKCVVLHGGRRTGKTTTLYTILNIVSRARLLLLKHGMTAADVKEAVMQLFGVVHYDGWRVTAEERASPLILCVDEYDMMFTYSEESCRGILDLLRAINQEKGVSLVLAGTVQVNHLHKTEGSPFNIQQKFVMPPFDKVEVNMLLAPAVDDGVIRISDALKTLLWEVTGGHPALLTSAGEVLQQYHKSSGTLVTTKVWCSYLQFLWLEKIAGLYGINTLAKQLLAQFEQPSEQLMVPGIVRSVLAMVMDDDSARLAITDATHPIRKKVLLQLADMGVLTSDAKDVYGTSVVAGPLVLVRLMMRAPVVIGTFDIAAPASPHMSNLQLMQLVCAHAAKNAVGVSDECKKPREMAPKVRVPQETVYMMHMLCALQGLLNVGSVECGLSAEEDAESKRTLDIAVTRTGRRLLIEVIAHERYGPQTRKGTYQEHLHRLETVYGLSIDPDAERWLVAFEQSDRIDTTPLQLTSNAGTNILHVWHTVDGVVTFA